MIRSLAILLLCFSASAEIIPSTNRIDWIEGVTVGVPGGIPSRTTIFTNLAVGSIGTNIQLAVAQCPSNQVVFLPAGNYTNDTGVSFTNRQGITIRGAGIGSTIVWNNSASAVSVFTTAVSGGGSGSFSSTTTNVVGGYSKGASNITVLTVSGMFVGGRITFSQFRGTNTGWTGVFEVWTMDGIDASVGDRWLWYPSRIESITGTNLVIWPPLPWELRADLTPVEFHETTMASRFCSVEDMTIVIAGTNSTGVAWQRSYGSWVKNVYFQTNGSRSVQHNNAMMCEVRDSNLQYKIGSFTTFGLNSSRQNGGLLFVNNWMDGIRNPIQLEQCVGSAVLYNYCTNSGDGTSSMTDGAIQANHAAHCIMNLYEGNICENWQSDPVHGSTSHSTLFRNNFHGLSSVQTAFIRVIDPCRGQYWTMVAGNVLGNSQTSWLNYELPTAGQSAANTRTIYRLGAPNQGNNTVGSSDWHFVATPTNDINVLATMYRHGNYDYFTNATVWDSDNADHSLPASYIYTNVPSWWDCSPWPPIGPDLAPMVSSNPALNRYYGITPTVPAIQTVTISADGTTWTFAYDGTVTFGSGGNSGFATSMSGGASSLAYSSGSGSSSLVYYGNRIVLIGETGTADYTQPGDGLEYCFGNDMASFSGHAVVNNSTQAAAVVAGRAPGIRGIRLGR